LFICFFFFFFYFILFYFIVLGINVLKLNADGKPQALAATDLNKANIESFDLRMYYCASEVCNMINGYVLTNDGNSDIYYTITESGAAAVETDSEATCTKENIGEVITTDGSTFKICLDDDEALTVAKGRYILGDGVGKGPFASNTKKMIEVDDGGAHIYVVNDLKGKNFNIIKKKFLKTSLFFFFFFFF